MLRMIIMRVKESISSEMKPQIVERVIEHQNTVDPTLLNEQRGLIDSLYLEIDNLKEKLQKNDNIDDQINILSARHSRDTLVKVFGLETKPGDDVTNHDIKAWLLKETLSKKDLEAKLADIKQTVAVDFDRIGDAVRMELNSLKEGMKSNIAAKEVVVQSSGASCDCDDMVNRIVAAALAVYDADKTGLVDYALESAGGQVISTRCSESYQTSTAVYSVFGIPLWYPSNSPRIAITPGATPGDCWAFQGFPGYLLIKLYTRIDVTGFTLEHTPRQLTPNGQVESAPNKFTVWGLQDEMDHEPILFGSYEYSNDSTALQYFPAGAYRVPEGKPRGHELVELRIESNHGNPLYTCLYRFRVHGNPTAHIKFYGDNPDR